MKKKFLLLISCVFFIILSSADAHATNSSISSLSELKQAFKQTGGTYTLSANISDVNSVMVISDGEHILDLNGHSISGSVDSASIIFITGGSLEIIDSVNGGNITNQKLAGVGISGGRLTIKGGTFTGDDCAVYANGGMLTIYNGTYNGEHALFSSSSSENVSVYGGTFNGITSGCLVYGGNISVSGGNFSGVEGIHINPVNVCNVSISSGKFIGSYAGGSSEGNFSLTITGGNFSGTLCGFIFLDIPQTLKVSGGSFKGTGDSGFGISVSSGKDGMFRPYHILKDNFVFDNLKVSRAIHGTKVCWCTSKEITVIPSSFKKPRQYSTSLFSDVDNNAWYGENSQKVVSTAYEYGIMNGYNDGTFRPDGNIRISEAIKMAVVVYSIHKSDNYNFQQSVGENWYDVYVNYAVEQELISTYSFSDYTAYATRAEMAYIFSNALPLTELPFINLVNSLPDVLASARYKDEIFLLYNAGILTGNDSKGTFTPSSNISRAQAAAIIARLVSPNKRKALTFGDVAGSTVENPNGGSSQYPYVGNVTDMHEIYKNATNQLAPTITVRMDTSLYNEVSPLISEWGKDAIISGSYSYNRTTSEFSINLKYQLLFEEYIICKDSSLLNNASYEAVSYLEKIDAIINATVLDGMTDREKLKVLHDYMIANYQYDMSMGEAYAGKSSFSFFGLLDNATGVCQAYAELFYLLANRVGIECSLVRGSAGEPGSEYTSHMWNSVYMDGETLYIDVTYDDPIPDTTLGREEYFLISKTQISKDHIW